MIDGGHESLNLVCVSVLDDFSDELPNLNGLGIVIRGYCWDTIEVRRILRDILGVIVSCRKNFLLSISLFGFLVILLTMSSSLLIILLDRSQTSEVPLDDRFHIAQACLNMLLLLFLLLLQLLLQLFIKILVKGHILSRLNLFLNLVNLGLRKTRSVGFILTFEEFDRLKTGLRLKPNLLIPLSAMTLVRFDENTSRTSFVYF